MIPKLLSDRLYNFVRNEREYEYFSKSNSNPSLLEEESCKIIFDKLSADFFNIDTLKSLAQSTFSSLDFDLDRFLSQGNTVGELLEPLKI